MASASVEGMSPEDPGALSLDSASAVLFQAPGTCMVLTPRMSSASSVRASSAPRKLSTGELEASLPATPRAAVESPLRSTKEDDVRRDLAQMRRATSRARVPATCCAEDSPMEMPRSSTSSAPRSLAAHSMARPEPL